MESKQCSIKNVEKGEVDDDSYVVGRVWFFGDCRIDQLSDLFYQG